MHIATVMAKHGLKELFSQPDQSDGSIRRQQAKRLRTALEELGPTFSKLGQVLSTRPDLLPAEYIEELAMLQSHVPPMPEREVVRRSGGDEHDREQKLPERRGVEDVHPPAFALPRDELYPSRGSARVIAVRVRNGVYLWFSKIVSSWCV